MSDPIINPSTAKILQSAICNLPQSLLLTGEPGVGLSTIGRHIAKSRGITPTVVLPEKDEKIDLDKGVISVESMRRLYDETRTKTVTERIIIIDYAERMTHQAQNAFLKLLEEPGDGVHFILLSHSIAKLLPTIISRTEHIDIKPITAEQSNEFLDTLGMADEVKRSQLLFIASGLPAEITRLSSINDYFDRRSAIVRDARDLLRGKLYQKLLIAQRYKDDRLSSLIMLTDAANILKKSIVANPSADSISYIDLLLKTYQRIEANGNIRLCLARLVI